MKIKHKLLTTFVISLIAVFLTSCDCEDKSCSNCTEGKRISNVCQCVPKAGFYQETDCAASGHGTYDFNSCSCLCETGWSGPDCSTPVVSGCGSTVSDIDGNIYNIVEIGTQCWLKENLKTFSYNDGSPIEEKQDSSDWSGASTDFEGAWCYYENNAANNPDYGKLYNFYVVIDTKNVCPAGWHVPSGAEVDELLSYLGGESVAGGKMKTVTLWDAPNTGANNSSVFSAKPAGGRQVDGGFYGKGNSADFWTSDGVGAEATSYLLSANAASVYLNSHGEKGRGKSVRCIKD